MSGRARRALLAGALGAAAVAGLAFLVAKDLRHKDALDYAQIAREIASGHGFTSRQAIYALHLRFLHDADLLAAPWPNLHRFPLQSLVLVPLFWVLGPSLAAILLTGALLVGATAALIFDWGDRALGRAPAVAATVLLVANGALFADVAWGIPEVATCFFFTLAAALACAVAARARRPDAAGRAPLLLAIASGAALGLAALSRTNAVVALPGLLWVVWRAAAPRRALRVVLLCAGLLAAMSPWLVRNALLTGNPLFSLHSYFLVPGSSIPGQSKYDVSIPWVRDFVSPAAFMAEHPGAVWRKWQRNTLELAKTYPWLGGTLLVPILAWLALVPRIGGGLQPLAVVVCSSLVANAALCGLTDVNLPRYYSFLLPGMMLLAIAVLWSGLRRFPRRAARTALLAVATLLLANPPALLASVEWMRARGRRPPIPPRDLAAVVAATPPDAVVLSDLSHVLAWTSGRRAIRTQFTRRPDGTKVLALLELDDEFGPIDALYLSRGYLRADGSRAKLDALRADPRFEERYRCEPLLASGALLCVRRPGPAGS